MFLTCNMKIIIVLPQSEGGGAGKINLFNATEKFGMKTL